MRKSVFVIAVVAAACSSVAFAGEVKQGKKATAPTGSATQMTNSEMDKVTAAGIGHAYAFGKEPGPGWLYNNGLGKNH